MSLKSICWASDYDGIGNAYGYSVHMRNMRAQVSRYLELNDDSEIAVHIIGADGFVPIEGKLNVLFTMFEAERIPPAYAENIQKADALIVPCKHNEQVFRRYTDLPIYVCNEGTDTDFFSYKKRTFPDMRKGEKFRFLWIGANNPRKGKEEVIQAWQHSGAVKVSGFELYMKTTGGDKVKDYANVIFNSSNMSGEELVELYHSSHCFLFPTRGEGWGLTLTEAMSTGCPSIATRYSGTKDFFDDYVGYTLDYKMREFTFQQYALTADMASPDVGHLCEQMFHVFSHYKEAVQKAKLARRRIEKYFTWEVSGLRLFEILKGIHDDNESRKQPSTRRDEAEAVAHL